MSDEFLHEHTILCQRNTDASYRLLISVFAFLSDMGGALLEKKAMPHFFPHNYQLKHPTVVRLFAYVGSTDREMC